KLTVANTGYVQTYRGVSVFGSIGGLMEIDMDSFEPKFVRSDDRLQIPHQGKVVVKAADIATWEALRKYWWPSGETWMGGGYGEVQSGASFKKNNEGLALVPEE